MSPSVKILDLLLVLSLCVCVRILMNVCVTKVQVSICIYSICCEYACEDDCAVASFPAKASCHWDGIAASGIVRYVFRSRGACCAVSLSVCVCLCIIKRRQRHAWPAPANDCMPFLFIKTRDAHLTHSACDECPSFVCSLGAWVDCHTLSHRRQAPSGTTCARARALSLCRNRVTFELYLTTTHTAIHGCISALF